jgi:hypothetical protein
LSATEATDELRDEAVRLIADLSFLAAHPAATREQKLEAATTRLRVTRTAMCVWSSRAALEAAVAARLASPEYVPPVSV